ncbi:MAG: hypothetical protein JWQ40_1477 [Segetibacter sp.]|nr:hypothetical protein [Segetibacter sp.]
MKKNIAIVIIAISITSFTGCYYDKEVVAPPGSATCDTTQMSYTGDIVNIFNNNGCFGCHTGPSGNGGVNLNNHSGAGTVANDGRLLQAITWTGPQRTHMPQGGPKLTACEIGKIRAWVKEGAKNN